MTRAMARDWLASSAGDREMPGKFLHFGKDVYGDNTGAAATALVEQ
jgi:hypothetical protein